MPLAIWQGPQTISLAGVAAGAVFGDGLPPDTALLTQGLAVTDRLRTLWDAYLAALLPHLLLLAGVRLSGSSACGQPAAAALLLLRDNGIDIERYKDRVYAQVLGK